ncbi:MAG: nicotinate (nicotinamide) nucleotide adenylyltransferase [Proteobacteria bacterium]|jgi:nicotinate-nucleotide adenylyltransferase|nr:nicotinate (nicotinamide) nucleotide adenylyltransferase [Pseudomonadota bacterium]
MEPYQSQIEEAFDSAFGRTPLRQRLDDIEGEVRELVRFTDLRNLKEEAGDALCSLIQLCNECGWDAGHLIQATLAKIEDRKLQYRSLGRKIKVAILGGAFNPVTKAHIRIAQFVLNTSRTFDEVWLMPCGEHHMFGKEMASAEHRLNMVEIACEADGRIKPFDYEIRNKLSGETYQTVKLLLEEDFAKNQYDFSWIIGMDNANEFDRWVNYEHLEKMIRFIVVPRDGVERDPDMGWYLKPPHIFLGHTDGKIGEVSSTMVRECLKNGISLNQKLLDEKVLEYIREHELYGIYDLENL